MNSWPSPSRTDSQPTPTITAEANAAVCQELPTSAVHQRLTRHTRFQAMQRGEVLALKYRKKGDIRRLILVESYLQALKENA